MKKTMKIIALTLSLFAATCGAALATPSTQIWIPSTDIQPYKTLHLGIDNYIRTAKNSTVGNVFDIGLTMGVLPFEKLQMEIGIDYLDSGRETATDSHPIFFNAKLGTPEESLFKYSPAIAVGIYNVGTKFSNANATTLDATKQNIVYGLLAKTLPVIGRISAGGYHGSGSILVDDRGKSANDGLLLSWDRTLTEISDKLWAAVDYQSGKSGVGAVSFGLSWAFSKNVSVIFGYDIYNNVITGGKNTFTTQLDINFP